jgi:transposase
MEIKRPFSEIDWLNTPQPVRQYIEMLEKSILQLTAALDELKGRTEKLEERVNKNSQNSSKPPSSDAPFKKPKRIKKKSKRKRGGQKGHPGHRQQLLEPTKVVNVKPTECNCGSTKFKNMKAFYTHQQIELPEIDLDITHHVLHKGCCTKCGKIISAKLPTDQSFGYGPRMSALIAELSGMQGTSRQGVRQFLNSVLGVTISTGAIQKVIDRVSEAILPAYEKIGQAARSAKVGYIDETSWFKTGVLHWLWVMATSSVAFYIVHSNRSREAFNELIGHWQGILVSDNFRVYQNWVEKRQNCLAHFIRKARALSENADSHISSFGQEILTLLQMLCYFAKAPPSARKWKNFYKRFLLLLMTHDEEKNEAGKLARSLAAEMDSLWVFLDEHGVEPTNNRAERALRFGVIWRKRCFGCQSDKGARWVERILSLKETCRLKSKASFTVLVDLTQAYFKEQQPNLAWIR